MGDIQIRKGRSREKYRIRPYRPRDKESFLALHETVYSAKSERWFDWRYETPYLDHVPIFVAVEDGTVAGAEAFLPFRVEAGETETLAVQPADAMVHPDHRRCGLFSRITKAAIEYYADAEPTHCFNFPTAAAKPALVMLGWRDAGQIPTWYRFQNPRPMLAERLPRTALRVASMAAETIVGGYCRVKGRTVEPDLAEAINSYDGVPAQLLATLAARRHSKKVRVRHDESFYRWRFGNPRWESVTTYVVDDGEPTAAVVAATRRTRGATVTKVLDAATESEAERRSELAALLEAVIDDASESDVVAVAEGTVPNEVLSGCGFLSDEHPLLARIRTPTHLVVRPVEDRADCRLGGRPLSDVDAWKLTFADQDTPF